ncbi:hypothetical protein WMF26_38895 [Sorangium sp. So ce185]|uniref:hypothetical protein n=1 Tax=Sorangium sp. So ce185 TaxID=3133287 RepID=UPI003F637802
MKFLYLADLHYARHHAGQTLTRWRWYVHSFGPMANEAYSLFERGTREGWLSANVEPRRDEEDSKTVFYNTNEVVPSDMMVSVGKVREWIKRFGDDTPRLLRYVYGSTEPMDGAREGEPLDFSRAQPLDAAPLKGRSPTNEEKRRFAEISARLKARYDSMAAANATVSDGPRDSAFFRDLPVDDERIGGEVVLTFKGR